MRLFGEQVGLIALAGSNPASSVMDVSKLRNNKYFVGRYDQALATRGWFVGAFFDKNHPCKTDEVEIVYQERKPGDICEPHYHRKKIELLIIIEGRTKYNVNGKDIILRKGDFLFVDVNNIISEEVLEPSKIFAIHAPSIPGDKVVVDKK